MSESIHIIRAAGQFADISAICQLDTLGNGDNHGFFLLQKFRGMFQELVDVKHYLRQVNQVRSFTLLCPCKRSGTGEPARITSHNLKNGDGFLVVIGEAKRIPDDLLGRSRNIFCRASEAGCVIRKRQVIVNRLGHSQELLLMSLDDRIIRQFLDGVHGVVSTDIDESLNLQLVQNLENFLIDFGILMDLRQLKPAGTQKCGRGSLQQFNVHVRMNLGGQIHILLIQKALNAVEHSVYFMESSFLGSLIDTSKTGINHRSGAARLSNNNVALLCHFLNPPK